MTDIQFPEGFVKSKTRVLLAELVRDLGPISGHELVQETGKFRAVVSRAMRDLQAVNIVYIESWTHPGESNALAPVWALRTGKNQYNATRPKPLTMTEINVRWNARHAARRSAAQRAKRGTVMSIWAGLL